MKLLKANNRPEAAMRPQQTMAWRPYFGPTPEGLGEVPKFYDDGYWYVRQAVGAGDCMMGKRSPFGTIAATYMDYGDPNDPNSIAYDDAWRARAWGESPDTTPPNNNDYPDPGQAWQTNFWGSMAGPPHRSPFGTISAPPPFLRTPGGSNQQSQLTPDGQEAWDAQHRKDIIAKRAAVAFGSPFRVLRYGLGAHATLPNPNSRPEITAADNVMAYFDSNACTRDPLQVVSAFQSAYNASKLPGALTPDGQYGGNTQRALQNVLDEAQADAGSGPSQAAPNNCFGMSVPTTPSLDPLPAAPPAVPQSSITPTAPPRNYTPWIIGSAVAVGAGVVGYAYYRRHHR